MAASEQMKTLMKKRYDIESEIAEQGEILASQKDVGMDGPLIDEEGYPRADIDVYAVRHARHRIACLQTDHKLVMKDIEAELYHIHEEIRQRKEAEHTQATAMEVTDSSLAPPPAPQAMPFVHVDRVDAGSPAADAGLEAGDELVEFGSVSAANFTSLKQIGELVQHSIGRAVRVRALRRRQALTLSLTPGPWSGRGNLGCNIVPMKQ